MTAFVSNASPAFCMEAARANATAVARLTALWALSESALGGVLHALRVPLMGVVMAGTAVVLISLIAHYAERPRDILKALLLVMLVKAVGSPHTPVMAYTAVAFQGVFGFAVYSLLRPGYLSTIPFALVALVETALLKVFMLALFFGAPLWDAVDEWGQWVLTRYFPAHAGEPLSLAWGLLGSYLGVYVVSGLAVGWLAARLPARLAAERAALTQVDIDAAAVAMANSAPGSRPTPEDKAARARWRRRRRYKAVAIAVGIAAILGLTVALASQEQLAPVASAGLYFVRTVAILAAWYFFVGPWLTRAVQRWLLSRRADHAGELERLLAVLPSFKALATQQWRTLGTQYSGIALYRKWLVRVLSLSLVVEPPDTMK